MRSGSLAAGLCGVSATFFCQLKKTPQLTVKISKKNDAFKLKHLFRRLFF